MDEAPAVNITRWFSVLTQRSGLFVCVCVLVVMNIQRWNDLLHLGVWVVVPWWIRTFSNSQQVGAMALEY